MQFYKAYYRIVEVAEEVEKLKQEEKINPDDFLLLTQGAHLEEAKNLIGIPIQTIDGSKEDAENILREYDLDKRASDLYADTIMNGGYVLLSN